MKPGSQSGTYLYSKKANIWLGRFVMGYKYFIFGYRSLFIKGTPKLKTNFWLHKRINIWIGLGLTKKIINLCSDNFLPFFTLTNKPSRSRISASGVNYKCVGGQGEVRQGSRKSASWGKEKCIGVQVEVVLRNMWYLAVGLPLTHDPLFLDPWRISPGPLTHFFLWPGGLFFVEKAKSSRKWYQIFFWSKPNILKYFYVVF